MNKLIRRTFSVLAIVMLAFAMNIVVFAQGTTMIAVSKNSPAVGDKVTVSVTASESGTITVKYTSSMLTFVSCTGSGYTTSGNSVSFSGKSGDIVFTAAASGTASVIVSSTTCSGSSTTLAVGGGSTETVSEEKPAEPAAQVTTEEPAAEPVEEVQVDEVPAEAAPQGVATSTGASGSLNANGGFDINGVSYVVSERYSDSEIPTGFSKTTVKIGSSTYSEPTNGSITLLYLKPADNIAGSGVFYLYNAEAGTVSEFLMLGSSKDYVIISAADAGPSSAFTATTLEVTGGTTTAYTVDGTEFFYVYGTNKSGATGWFVYDSANETVSKMDESLLSVTAAATSADVEDTEAVTNDSVDIYINKLDIYRKVIMGLIVLCVILVFIVINTFVRSRDKDDFDGDVFANTPAKSSRKTPRSIVFKHSSREEEDEYYDDDEEYEDEEDYGDEYEDGRSSYIETAPDYGTRRNSSLNMMDLNDL